MFGRWEWCRVSVVVVVVVVVVVWVGFEERAVAFLE
jgi:hypothetical protein